MMQSPQAPPKRRGICSRRLLHTSTWKEAVMKGLAALTHVERIQLLKFVSAAIWGDLEVSPSEKTFLLSMALRLGLSSEEAALVKRWLETPPPPEEVDPASVPLRHRQLFLEVLEEACFADHRMTAAERESLAELRELLK
jgi:hypothetical protein